MKKLILIGGLLAAACTETGTLDPRAQAVVCLPKGIYLGEAVNQNWSDEQRALYRAAVDAQRIMNCPDPILLGYGTEDITAVRAAEAPVPK